MPEASWRNQLPAALYRGDGATVAALAQALPGHCHFFDHPDASAADKVRVVSWRLSAGLPTPAEILVDVADRAMTAAVPDHAAAAVAGGGGFAVAMVLAQALIALGRSAEAEALLA
ncbi:MAG: hypothetical protein QOG20_323 [Pseudonocardiales bacterium]|nr:hypothetical protein [Pseudonocardiales bacterium]